KYRHTHTHTQNSSEMQSALHEVTTSFLPLNYIHSECFWNLPSKTRRMHSTVFHSQHTHTGKHTCIYTHINTCSGHTHQLKHSGTLRKQKDGVFLHETTMSLGNNKYKFTAFKHAIRLP